MANQFLNLSRNLRKNQTDAERVLWSRLRNRQLGGYKFRRQEPIDQYIADFLCQEKKLIVELDGGQHNGNLQDETRTEALERLGYRVIRYWNNEVLNQLDDVVDSIHYSLTGEAA